MRVYELSEATMFPRCVCPRCEVEREAWTEYLSSVSLSISDTKAPLATPLGGQAPLRPPSDRGVLRQALQRLKQALQERKANGKHRA
jgi:hypothetical protein